MNKKKAIIALGIVSLVMLTMTFAVACGPDSPELVDPVRGTLVASTRLEGSWSGFVGPGRIWRTWIDADGKAHTIVAAVGLSRQPDQENRE